MLILYTHVALAATLTVTKVAAAPSDPASPVWAGTPATDVPVMAQQITYPKNNKPTIPSVSVKAVADDRWLAVRIEWADASLDNHVEVDDFTDGIALELPLGDPKTANPMMGGPGAPMYIANWKAVWQSDAEHGHADVQDYHPDFYTDAYPFASGQAPYPIGSSFETSDARRYLVATSAGNPVAKLHREWPVEELTAEGFGTLASQAWQSARAWGTWANGRWSVVIAVPRTSDDASNPQLPPGTATAMGFAVWDGAADNVGGRKHWSLLNDLVMP